MSCDLRASLALCLFLLFASCSGAQSTPPMPEAPPRNARATLAGPLCGMERCTCSEDASKIGAPPEGFKRFALRLGPSLGELWATLGENQLYKSKERAEECYYVDLEPGEHHFAFHAEGDEGFGSRFLVQEIGGPVPDFYDSFSFVCGAGSRCDRQALDDWKARVKQVDAGKHAPCGSVRVLGLSWITGRLADGLYPAKFHLDARLKVYEFSPSKTSDSAECQ